MSQSEYQRVDFDRLSGDTSTDSGAPASGDAADKRRGYRIRWWVIPFTAVLCCLQAWITVHAQNSSSPVYPTSTLISVFAFGFFVLIILAINPVLRLISQGIGFFSELGRAELISIIAALLVSAGVSTFGLTDQLIPIIGAPFNPEWNVPQAGWDKQLTPRLNEALYITNEDDVRLFREGLGNLPPEGASIGEWIKHYVDTATNGVPWGTWAGPITFWMIFVAACYAMFYSLTYLVLDNWSKREKLIFPLAKLPEALLPEDKDKGFLPPIFRTVGFWAGFSLAFLVLAYNAAVSLNLLPGMNPIGLGMNANSVQRLLSGSYFAGFSGHLRFYIMFVAIGIAFLLPLEISFSVWFYYLVGQTILFIGVRMGYGQNTKAFPTDWLWEQNAVTAQAAGGLLLFSAVNLVRCMYQIITDMLKQRLSDPVVMAKSLLPVIGLFVSLVIMTAWVWWNGVPLIWALIFCGFLALITLGLMRIVAEGGIYWFQADASFFHFWKMMGISSLSPVVLGPLLPIYSVLFLDIKTFLAPNLANAAKMRQDVGGNRFMFHLNVLVSLIGSIAMAIGYSLVLSYSKGAQSMNGWFYGAGPKGTIETASNATTRIPKFEPLTASWFSIGMLWVAFSMFIRRTVFWFPHPIGYIMLVNNLGAQLWFSFFIGWVLKKLIVQYGGKTTYDKARNVLIGLIMGELLAVCFFVSLSIYDPTKNARVDLNRY